MCGLLNKINKYANGEEYKPIQLKSLTYYANPKICNKRYTSFKIQKSKDENNQLFEAERGLLYDLVEFVKTSNVNNKIIFLGDQYQLPPVGEKKSYALQKDFLESEFNYKGESYLLSEVKRQEDGSYILTMLQRLEKLWMMDFINIQL